MNALIPLLTTSLVTLMLAAATPAQAVDPQEVLDELDALIKCPPAQTEGGTYDWRWRIGNAVDDPSPPSYYRATWSKITHYGPDCHPTSYSCDIAIDDTNGVGTDSHAQIQWVSGGSTSVTGAYKGIPFAGTWGFCHGAQGHVSGLSAVALAVRGTGDA